MDGEEDVAQAVPAVWAAMVDEPVCCGKRGGTDENSGDSDDDKNDDSHDGTRDEAVAV